MYTRSYSILIIYTVLSAIITFVVALILSLILAANFQKMYISAHSEFYKSFIEAIPSNYSEIIPELNLPSKDEHETLTDNENNHLHDSDSSEHSHNEVWAHLRTDIFQTPSVMQLRIFDNELNELLSVKRYTESKIFVDLSTITDTVSTKENSYYIIQEKPIYIINYYFPIVIDNELYGIIEISDMDIQLNKILVSSRRIVNLSLSLGGSLLYLLLFVLFFQAFKNQNRAISRLDSSQSITIHSMSMLAELRDQNTGAHIIRTCKYCKIILNAMKKNPKFRKYITKHYIEDVIRSAPLHDIGKVGVPDRILKKPGKLTSDEFEIIKTHPVLGAEVLKEAVESLDFQSYFEIGSQIVLYHHENWDGTGYPEGLKGTDIPLSARIMAIADVYDALTTLRPYKKPFSHDKAMEIMLSQTSKKFDPELIEIFKLVSDEFQKISLA